MTTDPYFAIFILINIVQSSNTLYKDIKHPSQTSTGDGSVRWQVPHSLPMIGKGCLEETTETRITETYF